MKKFYYFTAIIFLLLFNWCYSQITVSGSNGANGTYTTLRAAFNAINGNSQTGMNITISVTGNTTETATAVLNAGTWTSLTISPSGGSFTISGSRDGAALIEFNGADNVTINGINSGGNYLTISNTSTSDTSGTSTIRFYNDATNNTITNCAILGSSTVTLATNGGNIFISTAASGGSGNDNITISNCNIGPAGSNLPSKLIYANGSTTSASIANSNITITNNNLYDFFLSSGCAAIYVLTGNTDFTITNNKIYQTSSRTFTAAGTMSGIYFSNSTYGDNVQIRNNIIGYASSSQTGTLTLLGSSVAGAFQGIYFNGMSTAASACRINKNTISDISLQSSTGTFYGINNATSASSNTINIDSNIVRNIATTTTTGGHYGIYAGSATTLTVSNNLINNITRTGSGLIYGIQLYSPSNVTMNYNTISNLAINNTTSASSIYGVYSLYAVNVTGNYNNIFNISTTSTSSVTLGGIREYGSNGNKIFQNNNIYNFTTAGPVTFYGIYVYTGTVTLSNNNIYNFRNSVSGYFFGICNASTAASVTHSIYNNTIKNLYTSSGGSTAMTVYGIYGSNASTSTTNCYNNTVDSLVNTGRGQLYGIYFSTNNYLNVYSNTVSRLRSEGTGASGQICPIYLAPGSTGVTNCYLNNVYSIYDSRWSIFGIYSGSGLTTNIYRNSLYDLNAPQGGSGGDSCTVYAIATGSGTTGAVTNVYNNFVSDIKWNGTRYSGASLYIFSTTSGTSFNYFYNTVYMNMSSTAGTSSAGIYSNTEPNVDLRNNIIVNLSTFGSGGIAVAYRRSSTTLTTYSSNSNNNLFYAGTPSASRLIFYDGTNSDQFLSTYKSRVSPRDANSFSENPPFVNVSTSPYNLHINPSVPTQVESGGIPITSPISITTDYDGDTRNSSTPDVGADEGNFIPNTPMAGTYTVGVSMFNKITGKNLYYEKFTRTVTKEVLVFNQETHNRDKSDINSSSKKINDISKKVITSDKKNVATTSFKSNDNYVKKFITITEDYYVLMENGKPYEGERYYLFNENPDIKKGLIEKGIIDAPDGAFLTITDAVNNLSKRGVSGAVIFELVDESYPSETYPLLINSVAGTSSSNTVTIRPASGVTTTISGASANGPIFRIVNSNYITIDGSNNGTNSRDLSIENTSTSTPQVVLIGSLGTTPITNVTIKNCNIKNGSTTSSAVVVSDGTTAGNAGYFNNITIQNNNIMKAYIGVYVSGGVAGSINGYNVSLLNNILNSTGTDAIRYIGLYMQGVNGFLISSNEIANFSSSESENDEGIWVASGSINGIVDKNNINNIKYSGTSGYGAHGIKVSTATSNANVTVKNNLIYNISGDGWDITSSSYYADNPFGILLIGTQSNIKIYNNSINLYGNTLNQTNAMSVGIVLGTGTECDIRNNSIVNNLGLLSSTGLGSAAVFAQSSASQFTNIDFNNYYVNPTGSGIKAIGRISTTNHTTMSSWRTATGQDVYSLNSDPGYTSNTNLIPDINNANSWCLSGNGIHISTVTDDYAGNPRPSSISAGAPDIGAYEFSAPSVSPNTFSITPSLGLNTIYVNNRKFLDLNFTSLGSLTQVNVKFYSGTNPPGISGYPTAQFMNGYFEITAVGGGNYQYDITYYYSEPQRGGITNESDIRLSKSDNNGTNWDTYITQGTGQGEYQLNTTNNTITVYGLTSFSVFTNSDHNAPLPVQIESFNYSVNGRDVKLTWITENENNNYGFEVERKRENELWQKVGFVQSRGNTDGPNSYIFEDKKLNSGKYNYRLKQIDINGNYNYFELKGTVDIALPTQYELSQNYPNPFNPLTKIDYALPVDGKVRILIYDMLGREVKSLVNEHQKAGFYTIEFNGASISSGTYIYRIIVEGIDGSKYIMSKKMVLVK